jgi:hypothetical protein
MYILTYLIQNKKLKVPTQKTKIKKYAFKIKGLLIRKRISTKTIHDNKKEAK